MKESEIRPSEIFDKYLSLSRNDIKHYFTNYQGLKIVCPGCGYEKTKSEFEKYGFKFESCNKCKSLFLSPRPTIQSFEKFYNDSESSKYWAEKFFPSVAEVRREKIFKPRAKRAFQLCSENGINVENLMDIGAGFGIFLEEWEKISPKTRTIAVEPSTSLAQVCKNKGFKVIDTIAEKIKGFDGNIDLITCFEVLEHVYDPLEFVETLYRLIKPGGCLLFSTLCVDGFDIQLLWERSDSISPPHHINFLSVRGLELLFTRAGLDDVKVITPGVLDIDIVKNAYKKDKTILENNQFIRKILENDSTCANFQKFLIKNKLSSHSWIFALKK